MEIAIKETDVGTDKVAQTQAKVDCDNVANDETKEANQIITNDKADKGITDAQDIDHDSHSNCPIDTKVISNVMGQTKILDPNVLDVEEVNANNYWRSITTCRRS